MGEAMGLIHPGCRLEVYRQLYADPAFCVMPPVSSMLEAGMTLLPPAQAEGQAGRPKKGLRVRKRKQSNGEFFSSLKYNMPMSAAYGPVAASSNTRSTQPAGAPSASSQSNVNSLL